MTATPHSFLKRRASGKLPALLVLFSLALPKCFACLHIYAWALALLAGSQVELCGEITPSNSRIVTEILFVVALLLVTFAIGNRLLKSVSNHKNCHHEA